MERYIERVKKSISAKEPPLKVAETRLSKRTKVELQTLLRIPLPSPVPSLNSNQSQYLEGIDSLQFPVFMA